MVKSTKNFFWLIVLLVFTWHAQAQDDRKAETEKMTQEFVANKGNHTCPLRDAKVDYKTLYLDENKKPNRGVDFISDNDTVLAIDDAYVVAAFNVMDEWTLILSHGDYFTTYTQMKNVFAKQGTRIEKGSLVGISKIDNKQQYRLHFELWNATEKLWPPDWVICGRKY